MTTSTTELARYLVRWRAEDGFHEREVTGLTEAALVALELQQEATRVVVVDATTRRELPEQEWMNP